MLFVALLGQLCQIVGVNGHVSEHFRTPIRSERKVGGSLSVGADVSNIYSIGLGGCRGSVRAKDEVSVDSSTS